jgi:hypothetical protein
MRKRQKLFLGFTVMVMVLALACSNYDPESDFKAEPIDGGKGVRIVEYIGSKFEISIPSKIQKLPVTHIGSQAFQNKNLIKVVIPNSVTFIENSAFANNQLTNISIPNSVVNIGDSAFANNQLSSVKIPNSVTYLSGFDSNQITNITIPDNVTSIGNSAFANNQLASVTIPNTVTIIGYGAFINNKLNSVSIPKSVVEIGGNLFNGNPLAGDFDFYINVDFTITIMGYNGTSNNVNIPESIIGLPVTSIGYSAFERKQLTSVTIPDSVVSIESSAFANNQLTSVTISNNVKEIYGYEFARNFLTSITIGADVYIPDGAFEDRDGGLHFSNGFARSYNNNGKQAGTYTRPSSGPNHRIWTRQ